MISVLIADDEQPAVDELAFLLGQDPRVGVIHQANSGSEAIRLLTREPVDAAFLDIHMPGLTGFDLARALQRFEHAPALVFVTADEEGALEAFDLAAVDYLLKPVRAERLARSVSRIVEALRAAQPPAGAGSLAGSAGSGPAAQPEVIAVTLGGTTRMIRRDDVRYVQAQGDYARLHTEEASYLVRVPMADLERQWADAGFVRVHRSYLVSLPHVSRVRLGGDRPSITVGAAELPVSRRLLPGLRERLDSTTIRPRP
ncbi:LytR/AlgR family response regulator transcription factor [Agromyces sp. MMS24-K17]|uniref:LytR/AlgR family response regulator transcription factor n=1 Tax=Agromyces sp. MMS24-K17 TaxID=3372850 RepID=UPI003754E69F